MIDYPYDVHRVAAIRHRLATQRKHASRSEHIAQLVDDLEELLDAYEQMVYRTTAADMALHGRLHNTYAGADVTAALESERLHT